MNSLVYQQSCNLNWSVIGEGESSSHTRQASEPVHNPMQTSKGNSHLTVLEAVLQSLEKDSHMCIK